MRVELTKNEISFLFHRTRERQVEAVANGATDDDPAFQFRETLLWKLQAARMGIVMREEK